MRRVLAFDTSTEVVAIGVGSWPEAGRDGDAGVLGVLDFAAPRAAGERLLPAVSDLLDTLGMTPADIDAVVVGRGPGSFTGVRIGVATAKGFARGLGVPLFGVSTLDAVAQRCVEHEGLLAVVADAMRHEVYPALFRCGTGGIERMTDDTVGRPEDVAARWAEELTEDVLLTGNGLAKYEHVFRDALGDGVAIAPPLAWTPDGAGLLAAAFRSLHGESGDAGEVLPVYTRLSDAEEAQTRLSDAEEAQARRAASGDDGADAGDVGAGRPGADGAGAGR